MKLWPKRVSCRASILWTPGTSTDHCWRPVDSIMVLNYWARHEPTITGRRGSRKDSLQVFASTDCGTCSSQERCTRTKRPRRTLTIRPEEQYVALRAAREREGGEEFANQYRLRAGIEGTISQAVRAFG